MTSHVYAVWMGVGTDCDDIDKDGVADICEDDEEACCYPDGTCRMLPPIKCVQDGGTPKGAGTTCDSVRCPILGACCYNDTCAVMTETRCMTLIYPAVWMGPGTDCDDLDGDGVADVCEPYTRQACCFADGTCQMLLAAACQRAGGTPMGMGTGCDDVRCPVLGACCSDGRCQLTTEIGCMTLPYYAVWMGPGTDCDDLDGDGVADVCEPYTREACCFTDGTCQMLLAADCLRAGGTPKGMGTTCDSVRCPILGACCYNDICQVMTETRCMTLIYPAVWMGPGTDCDDLDGDGVADLCEPYTREACCFADGTCQMLLAATCQRAGGTPMGMGTSCDDVRCPILGACCSDGRCQITTEIGCMTLPYYAVWMGPGTDCDDLDGDGVADICEQYTREACCFADGTCQMLLAAACQRAGGTPMGMGTSCDDVRCPILGACCSGDRCEVMTETRCMTLPYYAVWMGPGTDCDDLDGDGVADDCEPLQIQACCLRDGVCDVIPTQKCLDNGGEPQGPHTFCVGDLDGDGRDDTCATKWLQPPDLGVTGIDVDDSKPLMLADDWLCTETNAITRIYVWGSWRNDLLPYDPANLSFVLTIHADIPDPDGTGPAFSTPGKALWSHSFKEYSFRVTPYKREIQEGFWNPAKDDSYVFPGDTICWLYQFDIPAKDAFCQLGTASKPVVYWLSIQATMPMTPLPYDTTYGWKTATTHWNDDAVYCENTGTAVTPWFELRYPKGHPWAGKSVDLAFALDTEPCVLTPTDPTETAAK